jgi:hypothetical protein
MKKLMTSFGFLLLLHDFPLADEKPKSLPVTIPVSDVDRLTWSNLILDADAREARGEKLLMEAAELRRQAQEKLIAIKNQACGALADQYEIKASREGDKLWLARKPERKEPEKKEAEK